MKTPTFPATVINTSEGSFSQDVIAKTVEKSMKTCTDNLMRFLEGISSRLSQLELYCYNLDKSIGEMRSELTSDHEEADSKLKSLDKHLQEVCVIVIDSALSLDLPFHFSFVAACLFFCVSLVGTQVCTNFKRQARANRDSERISQASTCSERIIFLSSFTVQRGEISVF